MVCKINATGEYGGDKLEKGAWPLFAEEKFPNYEVLWQQFVVPRTDRPKSIHFSSGVPFADREIAGIHYSILHSFYVVYRWLADNEGDNATEKERFEYAFIKLSNICDLTEELLFKLLVLVGQLDNNSLAITNAAEAHAKDKLKSKIDRLTSSDIFDSLSKRGTSSMIVLSRTDILESAFDLKAYKALTEGIRSYRNVVVHSWHSFQINNKVPKIGYIKGYQDWASVTDVVKSNDDAAKRKLHEEFIPMRELAQQQVDALITVINELWGEAIPLVKPYVGNPPTPSNESSKNRSDQVFSRNYYTTSGTINDSLKP